MNNVIINGKAWPNLQAKRFSFDPKNGFSTQYVYKGTAQGALKFASALTSLGLKWEAENDGPVTTLTHFNNAVDPEGNVSNEQPKDSWQLLGNELQKSIYEHPALLYANTLLTGTTWSLPYILRYNTQGALQAASNLQPYPPSPLPSTYTEDQAVAWDLWNGLGSARGNSSVQPFYNVFQDLLIKDQDHYALAQYVLRHTQTVSDQYGGSITDANPEFIYTTAQMIAECTDGSLSYRLPTRMIAKINSIPAPNPVGGYLWGWRKLPSTEITTANRKVEITTDYCLEQWNIGLYKVVA